MQTLLALLQSLTIVYFTLDSGPKPIKVNDRCVYCWFIARRAICLDRARGHASVTTTTLYDRRRKALDKSAAYGVNY
ncbi:MAG: hypothetical protein HY903_09090 [Deltaproteobacteria bacterium]|nr:hypothetical protein [Deltaproteobacteria bacterium]